MLDQCSNCSEFKRQPSQSAAAFSLDFCHFI